MIDYIFDKKIKISKNSLKYNPFTWNSPVYQKETIEFFYNLIQENFCILDIGAQSGAFSLLSQYFPTTKFYSFEPDPISYNCLLENININNITNIIPHPVALSSKSEEGILNINNSHRGLNTLGSSLLRFSEEDNEKIKVKIETIDNLFLNNKVDLIKIDTEGAEYDILLGGINTIEKYKPKILLEYFDLNLRQFGRNIEQLNELIFSINYKITWIKEDNILIESK
jgi:FkbM family methyltransferase